MKKVTGGLVPTRREFLKGTAAVSIVAATSESAELGEHVHPEKLGTSGAAPVRARTHGALAVSRIKSVIRREDTVVRHGGNGDNWHMSWGADDRQYMSLCDGAGFSDQLKVFYNTRMLAVSGSPHDAQFHDLPSYPTLGMPTQGSKDTRYYPFGTLALDGYLYQFMSTFNRAFRPDEIKNPDFENLVRFTGSKLIYSPDHGRTWHNQDGSTPVVWESWNRRSRDTMAFFEEDQEAFSLNSVLQMGKNYEHNRDGYVYVYATNGNTEGTMNELVMFRVQKRSVLDRRAYEYFAGFEARSPKWSKDILARKPIHVFPRGWVNKLWHPYAWCPSVVYCAPLGVYIMANWGTGHGTDVDGSTGVKADDLWFAKPSYLGFWIAMRPWGPWVQIHEELDWMPGRDAMARAYAPQIAPKWIARDGRSFWLAWTDFKITDKQALKQAIEEDARNSNPNSYSELDAKHKILRMRRFMPFYSFNVQRVDLVLG